MKMADKVSQNIPVQLRRSHLNAIIDNTFKKIIDHQLKWQCNQCEKSYSSKFNLVTHIMDHQGVKSHVCTECGKMFRQHGHLSCHMLIHTGVKQYICDICSKPFRQLTHLKKHKLIHERGKPLVSGQVHKAVENRIEVQNERGCKRTGDSVKGDISAENVNSENCASPSKIIEHSNNSTNYLQKNDRNQNCVEDDNFTSCGVGKESNRLNSCGKVDSTQGYVHFNEKINFNSFHSSPQESSCKKNLATQIGSGGVLEPDVESNENSWSPPFSGEADVLTATKTTHGAEYSQRILPRDDLTSFHPAGSVSYHLSQRETLPRQCHLCGQCFTYPYQLKAHLNMHNDIRPFLCSECGMQFRKKHHLKQHTFTHSGLKPFVCKECGMRFSTKGNLHRHETRHEISPNYRCNICHKTFLSMQTFLAHFGTHVKYKSFQCDTCGKEFSRKSNLIHHVHLHYGSKPFKCQFCSSAFNNRGNLRRHMSQKHPEENYSQSSISDDTSDKGQRGDKFLAKENLEEKKSPPRMLNTLKENNHAELEMCVQSSSFSSSSEHMGLNFHSTIGNYDLNGSEIPKALQNLLNGLSKGSCKKKQSPDKELS